LSLADAYQLLAEIERKRRENKLDHYKPYEYQKKFHNGKGYKTLKASIQRAMQCGNQCGKTYSTCMEDAFHATGLYPDWFEGTRFTKPVVMIVAGKTNDTTKNILQIELFGDPVDEHKFGTGTVPKDCIGNITRKAGVPNAYSEVLVKHHDKNGIFDGWSKVFLLSYEMKEKAFMGYRADVCHGDEEPPQEIWSQFLRATLSTNGICYLSYTPEEGITEVVHGFMSNLQEGQLLVTAGWDDAPHFTEEMKRQKLAAYPVHEREMRSKGVPRMGSGKVFDVNEELISINPVQIPDHWPRICGVDLGWDHPFAAVWVAWDRDSDTFYVYDCYREERALMSVQAHAVNSRGDWIPVVWPHDGLIHDKKSGKPLADMYRDEFGMNMWHETFSNPPQPGKEEGSGGNGVEVGLMEILNRMESGRFKVFSTCTAWFEEFRMYHRKDGQLVKLRDDLMSATRYACMMIRHAQTKTLKIRKQHIPMGVGNW
jgi:phage terminase large subunit-like protein